MSVDHVLTIFSGKIPANSRNTHKLFSFFECIVSVRDVQIRQLGKSMGGQAKCRTARSSNRKCLDHMTSKSSTQTLMFPGRSSRLCASEVVKMQLHWHLEKTGEVILSVDCRVCYVCTRNFICLLVRVCEVIVFWWKPSPLVHIRAFWTVSQLVFSALFSKFVCSCVACCVKSNKNRVGIVPHELISMIHRLVLTNHLEDELAWSCSFI